MHTVNSVIQIFRETAQDLVENKVKLLASSVILNMFSSAVVGGLLLILLRMILSAVGEPNINLSNLSHFISNPLAIFLLTIYAVVVAFFLLLEFSILIFLTYSVRYRKQIQFHRTIYNALRKLKTIILNPNFLLFGIYFIALIPLAGGGISPFLLTKIKIPQFIISELSKSPQNAFLLLVGFAGLTYFNFRFIFSLPILIIKKRNFLQSLIKSWAVSKKYYREIIGPILLFEIIIGGALLVASILINLLGSFFGFSRFAEALISGISFINLAFLKIFMIDLLIRILADERIIHEKHIESDKNFRNNKVWIALIIAFSMLFMVGNLFKYMNLSPNPKAKIIAHRGFSQNAVENTIKSLRDAKKAGADFVETDVQITKDNNFVIFHDFDLARLANDQKEVSDMTLSEIRQLEIRQNGISAKIPTLQEFVNEADRLDIPLFIEMKVEEKNRARFLREFAPTITKMNLAKKHRIMSLDEKLATDFENLKPSFDTGLIIPFQFGDFDLRKPFNFYVIEEFSFSEKSAVRSMLSGVEIFIWTVNDSVEISRYFNQNNNGIITDESEKAFKIRDFFQKNIK